MSFTATRCLERNKETRRFWDAVLPGGVSTVLDSFLFISCKNKPSCWSYLHLWPFAFILSHPKPHGPTNYFPTPWNSYSTPELAPPWFLWSSISLPPNPRLQLLFFPLPILQPAAPCLCLLGPLVQTQPWPSAPHLSSYCSCLCIQPAPPAMPPQISFSTTSRPHFLCSPFSLLVPSRSLFRCAFGDSDRAKGHTRGCFS